MENWFYVDGTKQAGPVSKEALIGLFNDNHISLETYVWKKGLAQWERYKNVEELMDQSDDFELFSEESSEVTEEVNDEVNEEINDDLTEEINLEEILLEESNQEEVDEIQNDSMSEEDYDLDFSWQVVHEEDEIFFIKIGQDRVSADHRAFGPYSLDELKTAFEHKRISSKTLLTSAGLDNWIKIHNTPVNELFLDNGNKFLEQEHRPFFATILKDELELVGLIKNVNYPRFEMNMNKEAESLEGMTVVMTIYRGSQFAMKNVEVKVEKYDAFKQTARCVLVVKNEELRELLAECFI